MIFILIQTITNIGLVAYYQTDIDYYYNGNQQDATNQLVGVIMTLVMLILFLGIMFIPPIVNEKIIPKIRKK